MSSSPINVPGIRSRITCPHCWANFSAEDTLWVTEHEELRGDPQLGSDVQQRFLPTRYDISGNAVDVRGMTCQSLACPKCHLTVPRGILEMGTVFASILGIPSCGKSYFLASMTWKLRQTMPQYFRINFGDADPLSNEILNHYERTQFFNADQTAAVKLDKTEEQGYWYDSVRYGEQIVNYPRPFLFNLQPLPGHPRAGEAAQIARVLCMYDNAGESFQPGKDTAASPVTRHLARSNVLLFLFDPTQDPRFRSACSGKSFDPQITSNVSQVYRQDTVLQEAASRIRRHSGLKHGERHNRPLIVIVTKFDAWSALMPSTLSQLPLVPTKTPEMFALDWDRIAVVSQRTRDLLRKYSPEIVAAAESLSHEVYFVPVSATGCAPVADERGVIRGIRPCDIKPLWVEVPLLMLLARWARGMVPYATSRPTSPTLKIVDGPEEDEARPGRNSA